MGSGFVLTHSHHALVRGYKTVASFSWLLTIMMGILFIYVQANEYMMGEFTIADSVFGSVFYITTGLHAIHVIAGVTFLIVSYVRLRRDSITTEHHQGMLFAIVYWHLLDGIWLAVFVLYYWWAI